MVAKENPGWPPTAGTCDAATSTSAEPATFKGRKFYSSTFVPIDLDEPSSWFRVVPTALALARCFKARLTLGTILEDKVAARKSQWSAIGYREMLFTASARLGLLADELRGDSSMETRVGTGSIGGGISDLTEQVEADPIVLAAHRPGMRDWLIGAKASHFVRHAFCSVLGVRE